MEKHPDDKKPVVEYTAKITLPNGEVIEKTVSTEGDFPISANLMKTIQKVNILEDL